MQRNEKYKLKVRRKHFSVDNEQTDTALLENCLKLENGREREQKKIRAKSGMQLSLLTFRMLVLLLLWGATDSIPFLQ